VLLTHTAALHHQQAAKGVLLICLWNDCGLLLPLVGELGLWLICHGYKPTILSAGVKQMA
jgi:hypothetical protein